MRYAKFIIVGLGSLFISSFSFAMQSDEKQEYISCTLSAEGFSNVVCTIAVSRSKKPRKDLIVASPRCFKQEDQEYISCDFGVNDLFNMVGTTFEKDPTDLDLTVIGILQAIKYKSKDEKSKLQANYALGRFFYKRGYLRGAEKAYKVAMNQNIDLRTKYAAFFYHGSLQYDRKMLKRAIPLLRTAKKQKRCSKKDIFDQAIAGGILGKAYEEQGEEGEALKEYQEMLAVNKNDERDAVKKSQIDFLQRFAQKRITVLQKK